MLNSSLTRTRLVVAALATLAAISTVSLRAVTVPDFITEGKPSFTARLRWEGAQQDNLASSRAFTLRTAAGFTTASRHGFQAMLEGESITSLGAPDRYNASGTNPGGAGRVVIADPVDANVNQAWLSFAQPAFLLKAGRQRLVFDNARFIGDSGWRQNMQTFDAATLTGKPVKDTSLTYSHVWRVNRVFGNEATQRDFKGHAHFINASYRGWKAGILTAYGYRFDFNNSAANSSTTVGASFAGTAPIARALKPIYRFEYATQRDAGRNPVAYRADYALAELGAVHKQFSLTAGWEKLGSDSGRKGFATLLATLHAHNGWADMFLTTPNRGLQDYYGTLTVAAPGALALKLTYHDFHADADRARFGTEWDAQLTRKFGPHWTLLAKAAWFDGRSVYPDTTRLWLQAEFGL